MCLDSHGADYQSAIQQSATLRYVDTTGIANSKPLCISNVRILFGKNSAVIVQKWDGTGGIEVGVALGDWGWAEAIG